MIDITRLITISEAAGAAVQGPYLSENIECPEEYKDLTLAESNLYFENQMLRCELECRDIMDESVNDMIQSMIDQRNGIMTEAAEETEKKGFRAWVKRVWGWFSKIFKAIGDFFRNLIDKLTKHSSKTKEINDKFTEKMKVIVAELEHNQLADHVENEMKKKPFITNISYIDGAFLISDDGIKLLRNAVINADSFISDIAEAELLGSRRYNVDSATYNKAFRTAMGSNQDSLVWDDNISSDKEVESAILKIFLFKAKPHTYTDLFDICRSENRKNADVEYNYNFAQILSNNFALEHMILNSIAEKAIGKKVNAKSGLISTEMLVKYSTETLKEWDNYSKRALSAIDKASKDLDNESLTREAYNRIRKNYTNLMSYYNKKYSTFTRLFNIISSMATMYQTNIIWAKNSYLEYTKDMIKTAKGEAPEENPNAPSKENKEKWNKLRDRLNSEMNKK